MIEHQCSHWHTVQSPSWRTLRVAYTASCDWFEVSGEFTGSLSCVVATSPQVQHRWWQRRPHRGEARPGVFCHTVRQLELLLASVTGSPSYPPPPGPRNSGRELLNSSDLQMCNLCATCQVHSPARGGHPNPKLQPGSTLRCHGLLLWLHAGVVGK